MHKTGRIDVQTYSKMLESKSWTLIIVFRFILFRFDENKLGILKTVLNFCPLGKNNDCHCYLIEKDALNNATITGL